MPNEIDYDQIDSQFRLKRTPRSLISRSSRAVRVTEQDPDTGEWRSYVRMARKVVTDEDKARFLEEYRKWGRIGEAAAAAGYTIGTMRKHMEEDEEFAEAVMAAEEEYKDKFMNHVQDLMFNGTVKETYGKDGKIVSREVMYPVRLIELEMKRLDPAYREKQEIAVNHTGGVLIAPAEMKTIDDWEQRFKSAKVIGPTEDEE